MLECKASNQLDDAEVQAKSIVAKEWCSRASEHSRPHGGKPWSYALIAHNLIAENMSLAKLAALGAAQL